jgi:hypothetical protein
MPCEVNRTVNFGTTKSGLKHVGYHLLNTKGAIVRTRTEVGVHEVGEGTGIYAAMVCFPDQFRGTVLWDTGQARPSYAAEEYNYYDNNDVMLEQMKYVFNQLSFLIVRFILAILAGFVRCWQSTNSVDGCATDIGFVTGRRRWW